MPVKPSESKALIPAANTPICPKVIQLFIQLPTLVDRIVRDIWNEDGTVTDAFKASIGLTVGGLAVPTNVAASDGTFTTKVTVTWSPVTGAQSYTVWRNTANDSASAVQIGSPSATTYDDGTVVVGTSYYYWVKAVNAGGASEFSAGDTGYAGAASGQTVSFPATTTWTVPDGITSVTLFAVGGGGGGGGGKGSFPVGLAGGGGGGAGEYRTRTSVAVTPGDILTISVGAAGSGGSSLNNGSAGGASSIVTSGGTVLLLAAQGQGGRGTNTLTPGAGGAGGTGGLEGTDVAGDAGSAGTTSGGVGAPANNGYGAGGDGGDTLEAGSAGGLGRVWITY